MSFSELRVLKSLRVSLLTDLKFFFLCKTYGTHLLFCPDVTWVGQRQSLLDVNRKLGEVA